LDILQAHQLNAQDQARPTVHAAKEAYQRKWQAEIDRLRELQQQNSAIKDEHIAEYEQYLKEGLTRIDEHQIRLDAIRIILTTKPE
jgi:ATP-dependent helicase HepA